MRSSGKIGEEEKQNSFHHVKAKRKLTAAEKAEKKRRRIEYMTIFINGKQKRMKRPPTIEGINADEFIRRNADPIWLEQNEMWEYMFIDEDDRLPNHFLHLTGVPLPLHTVR